MTVDGGFPIAGSASDSVGILYPGERVDLLLEWDNTTYSSAPRFHVSLDPEYGLDANLHCSPTNKRPRNFKYTNPALRPNQSFSVFASSTNTSVPGPSAIRSDSKHYSLSTATAYSPYISLPEKAQQTILLYTKTQKLSIDNNHPIGFMNRTSWSPQSYPPFPLLSLPRSQWDKNQLIPYIPFTPSSPLWIDIIINNLDDGAHPFHLHGHSFYILASHRSENGWGSYSPYINKGTSAIKPLLNLRDPVRKDTVSVPRRGYIVIRFRADNEGIWMMHCHVLFHQTSGMAMGIHVGRDEEHEDVDMEARGLCGGVG